jgi:hypothetical protein
MRGAGHRSLRRFLATLAPVVAVASGLTPIAGAAGGVLAPVAAGAAQSSALSPRLFVLSSPRVRSLGLAQQAHRVGLTPSGAGSLLRHGRRVLVDVRFAEGAAAHTEVLRATGASIIAVSARLQTVTVAALPTQLQAVAAVPGVEAVQEEITPFTRAASCPQGSIVTEGDRQLEAARARNDFGVDGSGVTVGILSDSFNQWKARPRAKPPTSPLATCPGPATPAASNGRPRW